jgi:hypothetical protein
MPRFTLYLITGFIALGAVQSLEAQTPGRFQFKRGQVLQYKVEQSTSATDMLGETKSTLTSRVEQLKCWQVADVESDGTATLQLSLLKLKMQQRLPSGETWEYDSASPETSHKQLREQLGQFVGKALAVLRIDPQGKVLEVKSTLQGSARRYESELPFVVTLPGTDLQMAQSWSRPFRVIMDPPLGEGERYNAEQSFQVRSMPGGLATISFTTAIKDLPRDPMARLPLLQFQPQGEAVFDPKLGLIVSARYASTGVVEGHQGEGSRYEFTSEYSEQLVAH